MNRHDRRAKARPRQRGPGMIERPIDYYTARGAALLAERIKSYWISHGHEVVVELSRELPREKRRGRAWTIKASGLVAGLPVAAEPPVTPLDIVRRASACGKSPVEIEREALRHFPDLSRGELRAAFRDAGAANGW
jgi:hypothetical protein